MTVSTTTTTNSFSGNGSTTAFAYTFKIFAQGEVIVILRSALGTETVQTVSTHYSVSGVGSSSGGTVTFGSAPASGVTVLLKRATALTQATDYVENDPFPAATHEDALDKLTHASQELQEEVDRSIKLSRTNTMTSTEFTDNAAARASKVLAFDSSGELSVTQELGTFTGNWAASTAYSIRDLIKDNSAGKNNIWICITAHTSSGSLPIDTNTDVAKWSLIVDATSATASAAAAVVSAQLADDYAVKVSGVVTGSDYSSKAHAVGGTGVTDSTGSSKEWAEEDEDNTVAGAGTFSAKHHAIKGAASASAAGTSATSSASSATSSAASATTATNYATKVDGVAAGSDHSSKAWAVGGTGITDTSSKGAAKEWASEAEDNTVAGAGTYSALHYSAKASTSATAAAASQVAAAASALSAPGGLDYVYSTTTTDADPGSGVIRFNNATLASASIAYMDDNDANSVDVSTHLLTWDDSSTTSNRGTIKMTKKSTQSTYALYTITGASVDASGYVKVALTYVAGNGSFTNADTVSVHHTRTGDTGSIAAGAVDLDGAKLTLDGDADTSIHASTDDQIDIEIAGADDFRFTANTFSVLSGSTLNIDSGATIANSGTATGFPSAGINLLLNGKFTVAQRGVSFALTPNASGTDTDYTLDRWSIYSHLSNSDYTVTQETLTPGTDEPYDSGFRNSIKVDCIAADASPGAADTIALQQRLEGQNVQQLAYGDAQAKVSVVSFWHKHTKTGTHCVTIDASTGSKWASKQYTQSVSNTWEYATVTIPADTALAPANDTANRLALMFGISVGSNYTAGAEGAWGTTNGNYFPGQVNNMDNVANNFEIAGVQWELGSAATDFAHENYGTTLKKCRRYFQRYNAGAGASATSDWTDLGTASVPNTTTALISWHFDVEMRTGPTFSHSGAGGFLVLHGGANRICTAIALDVYTRNWFAPLEFTAPSLVEGEGAQIRTYGGSPTLDFSAEL